MDSLRKRFGNLLAANRKRQGLTQEALAAACDLSVDTIKKLEAGRSGAGFDVIERLAAVLRVDPAELFSVDVQSSVRRRALTDLVAELATLSDDDLGWARDLIRVARKKFR